MDTATRLKTIRARAEKLGWKYQGPLHQDNNVIVLLSPDAHIELLVSEPGYEAAERLLSCYEPGPVVKVDECELEGSPCTRVLPFNTEYIKPGTYKFFQ